jgi:hypothetical protein
VTSGALAVAGGGRQRCRTGYRFYGLSRITVGRHENQTYFGGNRWQRLYIRFRHIFGQYIVVVGCRVASGSGLRPVVRAVQHLAHTVVHRVQQILGFAGDISKPGHRLLNSCVVNKVFGPKLKNSVCLQCLLVVGTD